MYMPTQKKEQISILINKIRHVKLKIHGFATTKMYIHIFLPGTDAVPIPQEQNSMYSWILIITFNYEVKADNANPLALQLHILTILY